MLTCYDVIKTLLRTEKGTSMEPQRKYIFEVATNAAKPAIRKAVEEIYKVKVSNVNTATMYGKPKRVRQAFGYESDWKKAIVTLKDGHKIEVT